MNIIETDDRNLLITNEADKIKFQLCLKIKEYQTQKKMTQKNLAELLDIDEPEASRLLRFKIQRYSIERLLGYAHKLYPEIKLEIVLN